MKEERIKGNNPDQVSISQRRWSFLSFANFYRKFYRKFSKIIASLILILWTIDKSISNESESTQAKKQDTLSGTSSVGGAGDTNRVGWSTENLSSIKKRWKANFLEMDYFIFGAKKAFIYLQKTFIQTPIVYHFDLKCLI